MQSNEFLPGQSLSIAGTEPTYYLAYGSNCHVEQMKMRSPKARRMGKTKLPGYSLQFRYYADVYENPGQSVECAVWALTPDDEKALDVYEGFPDLYGKKYIEVDIPGMGRRKAMFYQMTDARGTELSPPWRGYAETIRQGYAEFSIPIEQMTSARGYEEPEPEDDDDDDDEGVLREAVLNEIDMNPASLREKAAAINAKGGMEFEMLVPPNRRSSGQAELNLPLLAQHFSAAIGRPVNYSSRYHGATRAAGHYCIEPDSSLRPDANRRSYVGIEFVTPPLPVNDLFRDLAKVKAWARQYRCYTNQTCGLHMNVSVDIPPGKTLNQKLNYVKLVLLMGDEAVLREYGREFNGMCKSAMQQLRNKARTNPALCTEILTQLRADFYKKAGRILHNGTTTKYESVNVKQGYVEFRSPGGDYLSKSTEQLENTMLRFVVALDAACDTNKYRRLYRERLEELVSGRQSGRPFLGLLTGSISPESLATSLTAPTPEKQAELVEAIIRDLSDLEEDTMPNNIINEGSEKAYLFTYDQHMNIDTMRTACPRAKMVAVVTLPNHILEFRSFPNVIARADGSVKGVLWEITQDDLSRFDTKYEVRNANYRRQTMNITYKTTGMFAQTKTVPMNYYLMSQEAIDLRPQLAAPNRKAKTDIANAYKAIPQLPAQQLADAPGWNLMPRSPQEQSMHDLRIQQRRRSGVSPVGDKNRPTTQPQPVTDSTTPTTGNSDGTATPLTEDRLDELFGKSYYYFGYGANSNETKFKSRCPSAKVVGVGVIPDYELEFRSYANIVATRGKKVEGLVWKISEQDLRTLDHYEGVGNGSYEKKMVMAKIKGTVPRALRVLIYTMTTDAKTLRSIAGPKETYLHTMTTGYRAHGMPLEQIANAPGRNEPEKSDEQLPIRDIRAARARDRQPETPPAQPEVATPETTRPPVNESMSDMRKLISLATQKPLI